MCVLNDHHQPKKRRDLKKRLSLKNLAVMHEFMASLSQTSTMKTFYVFINEKYVQLNAILELF